MKSRGPQGPSPNEIRQRSELDSLRREVAKLRKLVRTGEADAAHGDANGAPAVNDAIPGPENTDDALLAPPVNGAVADPLPAGTASERETLRRQVEELGAAKARLSRLYFGQLEEHRKRGHQLHEILESIRRVNAELALEPLLASLAATIRESLGFRIVHFRLRDPATGRLHARAIAGLEGEARARLEAEAIPVDACLSWLQDDVRIGNSYFISHTHPLSQELPRGYAPALGARKDWEWQEQDVLFVPLFNRGGELVATLSVDDPEDRLVPSREIVEMLEVYGHHAVAAIENARLHELIASHTRDLETAQRVHQDMHQLKANFLSTVSHELRTPITAIRAFVDTLLGAGYGEISHAQMRHFLSIINEESQRLSRLIESLLDLNRFDSGTLRSSRQAVELADVARETLTLLEPLAQVGRVSLKLEAGSADTCVDASRDQMRQLALHLGNNAVKFTPPGGAVTFVLTGDENEVGLEVLDTGIGIPKESLERIFERFYQVDSSLQRRYGGTGLGLAICRSIVDWHNGRIHAESTPGQGSRFVVRLPRRTRPRVIVQPGPSSAAGAEDILRLAIEMVSEIMGARVISLLCPEDDGVLVIRAAMGLHDEVVRTVRVASGEGVAGWVAQHRRPVCVSGDEAHTEVHGSGRALYRSRTFMSAPIEHAGRLLGVLNATDPIGKETFGAEDCHLFLQLAQRIAVAWQQALDAAQRQASVADTAHTLRQLVHHLEVGRRHAPDRVRLARSLGRRLGLGEAEVGVISFAASIHDVGMRTVGEEIVETPSALTPEEREQVRTHPEAGAAMMESLESASGVREVILSHHEWWNGRGYPRGLAGEDIPIGGRILAVVDAFESMTIGRAHRPPMTREQAVHQIEQLAGTQFDPRVVAALPAALHQLETASDAPDKEVTRHGEG